MVGEAPTITDPGTAVVVGAILHLAQDERLQAMAAVNDIEHFVQGCRAPWFDNRMGEALVAVKEAAS